MEDDDFGVVDEAVDHGFDGGGVAEDLGPGGEVLVAGDDEAGSFVAGGDEREEQRGGVGIEGDVADLVDDDERDASEPFEFVFESPGPFGGGEAADPVLGGGEGDATR